jgi:hypothetical protein
MPPPCSLVLPEKFFSLSLWKLSSARFAKKVTFHAFDTQEWVSEPWIVPIASAAAAQLDETVKNGAKT